MRIVSPKLGVIDFEEKEQLVFEDGLFGFEHLTKYLLIHGSDDSLFSFLQSTEDSNITFIVANPAEVMRGWEANLSAVDLETLEISKPEMQAELVIVTVPQQVEEISVNLLGLIVINCATNRGRQCISQNPAHSTRHLILEELKQKAG